MAKLKQVDFNPFAEEETGPNLVAVDFDPFAEAAPDQEVTMEGALAETGRGSAMRMYQSAREGQAGIGTFLQAPIEYAKSAGAGLIALTRRNAAEIERDMPVLSHRSPSLFKSRMGETEVAEGRRWAQSAEQEAEAARSRNLESDRGLARFGKEWQTTGRREAAAAEPAMQMYAPGMVESEKYADAGEGFFGTLGRYVERPQAIASVLSKSAPAMAGGLVLGKVIGAGTGLVAGETAAIRAASGTMIGSESVSAGLQGQESLHSRVLAIPDADLIKHSPRFSELANKLGSTQKAKEVLAREVSMQTPLASMLVTALGTVITNRLFGGDATAKSLLDKTPMTKMELLGRVSQDTVEEVVQSTPDEYTQYLAQKEVDPNAEFDLGKTVATSVVGGLGMAAPGHGYAYARDIGSKSPAAPVDLLNPAPADTGAPPAAGGLTSEQARQEAEQAAWEAEQAAIPPEAAVAEQGAPTQPTVDQVIPENAPPTQGGLSMPTAEEQAQAAAKEQEAAKLEEEHKQVQDETLLSFGAEPIISEGKEIGVTFAGKPYYHSADGQQDPKLEEAVNAVVKGEMTVRGEVVDPQAHKLRDEVIASMKESGVVPAGKLTPAAVTSAISKLNLTPANAVTVLKHELKMLEEKKGKGDVAKKGFYENLLGRLGGSVVPTQGAQNAIQVRSPAQEISSPVSGGQNITGDSGGVGQGVQGQETAGAQEAVAKAPAQEAQVERRSLGEERRVRYAEMTPEELRAELEAKDRRILTDHMTGVPNRAAYEEALADAKAQGVEKPLHFFADIDNLKQINSEYGNEGGDEAIKAFARALHTVDPRSFRLGGDEFVGLDESQEAIDARMARVREILDQAVITYTLPDGTVRTKKGIGFSYGTGNSIKEADAAGKKDKAARAAKGLRFERDVADRMVEDNAKGRETKNKPTRGEEVKAAAATKKVTMNDLRAAQKAAKAEKRKEKAVVAKKAAPAKAEKPLTAKQLREAPSDVTNEKGEVVKGITPEGRRAEAERLVAEAKEAAGDFLASLAEDLGGKTNFTPEQEQKLLPVLTKLFNAAFALGKVNFAEAVEYVKAELKKMVGDRVDEVRDALLLDSYEEVAKKNGAKSARGTKGAGEVTENSLNDVPEDMKPVVMDYMGWDENGEIDPEVSAPMTFKDIAEKYGEVSYQTWKKRLNDLGFNEAYRLAQQQQQASEVLSEEAAPDQIVGVEESAFPEELGKTAEEINAEFYADGNVIKDDEVVEKVGASAVKASNANTEGGKRWKNSLKKPVAKWAEADINEAASQFLENGSASGVSPELFAALAKEFSVREGKRLRAANENNDDGTPLNVPEGDVRVVETSRAEKARVAEELKARESAEALEKQALAIEKQLPKEATSLAAQVWEAYAGTKFSTLTAVQRNEYVRKVDAARTRAEDGASMQMYMDNAHKSFVEINNIEVPNEQVKTTEEAGAVPEGVQGMDTEGQQRSKPAVAPVVTTRKSRKIGPTEFSHAPTGSWEFRADAMSLPKPHYDVLRKLSADLPGWLEVFTNITRSPHVGHANATFFGKTGDVVYGWDPAIEVVTGDSLRYVIAHEATHAVDVKFKISEDPVFYATHGDDGSLVRADGWVAKEALKAFESGKVPDLKYPLGNLYAPTGMHQLPMSPYVGEPREHRKIRGHRELFAQLVAILHGDKGQADALRSGHPELVKFIEEKINHVTKRLETEATAEETGAETFAYPGPTEGTGATGPDSGKSVAEGLGQETLRAYKDQAALTAATPHITAAGYTMAKRVDSPDGTVTITWEKGVAPAKSVKPAGKPKSTPAPTPVPASTAPATVTPQSPTASQWAESGGIMSKFLSNPVSNLASNIGSRLKTHGLGWLSIDHLVEAGSSVNSKLSMYQDVSRKMQSMSKARVAQAAAIDAEWGKLDISESAPLHDIMRASTRAGFDPSKGGTPANADETKIQAAYDNLADKSPAAVKVFAKARDHYASVRAERKAISVSLLRAAHAGVIDRARETGDPAKLQSAKNDLEKLVNSLEEKYNSVKGPYFPLMRLGDWYTVAKSSVLRKMEVVENPSAAERKRIAALRKDGNHYTTSAYDSKSAAVEAQKKLEQRFGKGNVSFNMAEEKNYATEVLSSSGMEKVEAYINSSFDKEVAGEIRDMMAGLYYDALPEHHALKHEMRREGIHGEETDMRRVFAVSSLKSAHYVSRLKYADQLKAAMFAIQKEGKERGFQSTRYYNEIAKRAKLSMNSESSPIIDKLITASYLHHLGANPAFILQNATQVAMVTAPWLAARTSSMKASAAIARAYGTAGGLIKSSFKEQGWRFELDWENKVSKNVGNMLNTLLERNLLDITIEHDLGATAQLKSHVLGDALRFINLPVHVTELANRTVTALAAYELAVAEKKMSHDDAVDFAAKAVATTQLDYSALNAPRHMQRVLGSAPIAKLVMQFRKYQQGMLWIIGRSIHQSVAGESPEIRREARRTVFGLATTTGVMAGSLGLPMAGSALWALSLVASLFGEDDDPWDAAVEYEDWLSETMGPEAATLFVRGLPAYVFGVDLSKRLGLGDIANPLSFAKEEKDVRSQVGSYMTAAAGAPTGTVIDVIEGLGMASEGDWAKGAEKFAPLKVVQNLVRSSRFALEGMTTRNGAVVLPPDEFTPWDIAVKAVGFGTEKEARYYHDTGAKEGAKSAAMDGRKKLLDEYTTARMAGEDTTIVMEDIQAFNERHPEKGVRIDRSSRQKSLVARRNLAKSRRGSGVSVGKQDKPFMEDTAYSE